ncbi:alanine racemase [Nocardioides daeguensis]|uniref:Amino acid deaminase/aldolase n=1 Tax=Nocardioides daeguensis TaxID=908359 RepID=A0ABP6VYR5_9ACTN|nr:alanine racemase [Nocardioides daeguensis]MBV6726881.1 alanine racemase [Nocardioides daeguensis]MCR1774367.1 alanine racemase [Nocardioides daeguensis]
MTATQVLDLAAVAARTAGATSVATLAAATAHLEPPYAVVDLGALATNARSLVSRAAGKPVRLATKSVRSRAISDAVLELDGFAGVLALTLPEALWLARTCEDVVVGYPTADQHALQELAADERLASRVTLMVDSMEQIDLVESVVPAGAPPIRVCLDLDASLRLLQGRVHLGTRRSPVHSPDAAGRIARAIAARPRVRLVGMMAYEGQVAGLGDNTGSHLHRAQIRAVQAASIAELARRRAAAVSAVREVTELEFVNGGGTGSIETTVAEDAVTEVAAGSGLYCPTLFDGYRRFHPHPAAYFVTSVVRRPSADMATVLGGGWVASGVPGADRLPTPVWPPGLRLTAMEGAGEAQTPLTNAADLRVGDRVWFRHAKAGEVCERVNELHLVDDGRLVASVPTYRGEGRAFL